MKAEIRNLSCSKELVEQYSFYWNHGEWAFFTIDSKKCLFACDSSFGNYAYAGWDSHNGTFKEFLSSLRNDKWYVLGKISEKVFDLDATIEAWKNRIIEWRRNHKDYRDPVSKDEAREMWDLIKMASVSNESEFYYLLNSEPVFEKFYDDWWENAYEKRYPSHASYFVDNIFPMLLNEFEKEKL